MVLALPATSTSGTENALSFEVESDLFVLLEPSQSECEHLASSSVRTLHLCYHTFGYTWDVFAPDWPSDSFGLSRLAELDVRDMRGETVEAVKDVGRVQDRSTSLFTLLLQELEKVGSHQDVQIDSDLVAADRGQ